MLLFSANYKNNNLIKKIAIERDINDDLINWNLLKFKVGDVLIVFFWIKGIFYRFEGLCICINKKSFKMVDISFILRNVLYSIGMELCLSYFYIDYFFLNFLILNGRNLYIKGLNYIIYVKS
jgi:ribosomal protein L19